MTDPRVTKLAQVLIQYSLELQTGEEFWMNTHPYADELTLAVYKEALSAGAHVTIYNKVPGTDEVFFKYASDEQLEFISPLRSHVIENFDAYLELDVTHNSRELTAIDPQRLQMRQRASSGLMKTFLDRIGSRDMKWCMTVYPTHAAAQDADMSLSDYQDFVYGAGLLHLEDPVAEWQAELKRQQALNKWLEGKDQVAIKGSNINLNLSIKGRTFDTAAGKLNFPDGEIYTSPVEDSANGWVRFSYPGIYAGREVEDIQLWFEDGKVVKEEASKGGDLLSSLLDTDDGSRYLGELGIGTNYGIQRFTKNMLFDEKMGGTIHLAVGGGFHELGGKNDSGIHWDMLCDMADGEISVDGNLFYKAGKIVPDLAG